MADKTGYIGRNPNDSAVTVARQFFTASGVTTTFTFASGYLTGYLDVYVDGVKRRVADEFTATDGSTFDVLQGGVSAGSTVEAVAYKAFNAAAISGDITGNFDVSGNSTLGGSLSVTGGTTLSNLNVTGITTLGAGTTVSFANTAFNLGGTPDITVDLLNAVDINVSGAATIGGILTYEDVTNIDSVGIVTARTGVEVTANGLVVNAGVSTFAADVSIADKIVHTGDTNTAIRFPSADTITAETAGVERLRIDSNGDVGLVGIATATGLVVVAGSGVYAGHTGIITAVTFDGNVTGNVTGAVTGNADTATTATNVTVADESSDTTCFPLFATAATGNLPPKSGSNLTFNSSSGALTATSFVGALTGNVTGNTSGTAGGLTGTPDIDCGTGSFTGDVDIADKIVHTGDTNTAIRFPAADTFTVETGGSERLRITSTGNLSMVSGATILYGDGDVLFTGDSGNFNWDKSDSSLKLQDNAKAKFGTGGDLEIYHNGSNSYIDDAGTGVLYIRSSQVELQKYTGETLAQFVADGESNLYYDNSKKIATKSDGVDITGELQCDTLDVDGAAVFTGGTATFGDSSSGFSGTPVFAYANTTASNQGTIQAKNFGSGGANFIGFDGSGNATVYINTDGSASFYGNVDLQDNDKLLLGTGDDLEIYHDGSQSYIAGDDIRITNNAVSETIAKFLANGAVELNHNDSKKFETTSSGVTVTGTVSDSIGPLRRLGITAVTATGNLSANDAGKLLRSTGTITLTIPSGTFTAGDMITIFNVGTGNITIAQGSSTTLYNSADASTGNRTLAAKGLATIACTASNEFVVSGSNLS